MSKDFKTTGQKMALIQCRECKQQISTEAKHCPQCGASAPTNWSGILIAVFVGLPIAYLLSIAGNGSNQSSRSVPTPPPVKTEAEIQADNRLRVAFVNVAALRSSLRDPDSLAIDQYGISEDGGTSCVTYRAKNGFGGMNKEMVVLNGDGASRKEKDWNRLCAGKELLDITKQIKIITKS